MAGYVYILLVYYVFAILEMNINDIFMLIDIFVKYSILLLMAFQKMYV